ncbi:hypothetical protein D3C85_195710 [compost metagenome]
MACATLRRVPSSTLRDWSSRASVSLMRFSVAKPANSGRLKVTPTVAALTRVPTVLVLVPVGLRVTL